MRVVRAPSDIGDALCVSAQNPYFIARSGIPDAHSLIVTGGGQARAVGTPGQVIYPVGMAGQYMQGIAVGNVPHMNTRVATCRGNSLAVDTPCQTDDGVVGAA